jgi:hypothetical protein
MRACPKFGIAMLLILSTSQVLAEEAFYCVDTAAVGFVWDRKGEAKPTEFSPERHNVKVVGRTRRWEGRAVQLNAR